MVLARWQATIVDELGNVQGGASVEVRRESAGSPLASLFSDRDGVTPIGNPLTTGSDGFAAFHTAGGAHRITATKGAFSRVWRYAAIGTAAEYDISAGGSIAIVQNVDAGYAMLFETGTSAPPTAAGAIRFNNAALGSATQAYIDDVNAAGSDITAVLMDLYSAFRTRKDNIIITDLATNAQATFRVDGATDNGSYITLTISNHSGATSFPAGPVNLQRERAGIDGTLTPPVAFADIQTITTARLLGRSTAGTGVIEQLTLSQALDLIGSAAQGDVLYRGASAWARLGAGTNRQFLQTQGAAANPQWASPGFTLLVAGTVSSAATLDLVLTSYMAFRGLKFVLTNFIPATDAVNLHMRVSTDGGATYDATAGNYRYVVDRLISNSTTPNVSNSDDSNAPNGVAQWVLATDIGNGSNEGATLEIDLMGQTNSAMNQRASWRGNGRQTSGSVYDYCGSGQRIVAQDTDAVRFLMSSGNIASGNYAVYGMA